MVDPLRLLPPLRRPGNTARSRPRALPCQLPQTLARRKPGRRLTAREGADKLVVTLGPRSAVPEPGQQTGVAAGEAHGDRCAPGAWPAGRGRGAPGPPPPVPSAAHTHAPEPLPDPRGTPLPQARAAYLAGCRAPSWSPPRRPPAGLLPAPRPGRSAGSASRAALGAAASPWRPGGGGLAAQRTTRGRSSEGGRGGGGAGEGGRGVRKCPQWSCHIPAPTWSPAWQGRRAQGAGGRAGGPATRPFRPSAGNLLIRGPPRSGAHGDLRPRGYGGAFSAQAPGKLRAQLEGWAGRDGPGAGEGAQPDFLPFLPHLVLWPRPALVSGGH